MPTAQASRASGCPLDAIRAMAPQTDRSDIILSIHPEHVDRIADGTKDHEFRNYKIPQTVSRFWIYVTRPMCELQYMAIVGPAREPGQIDGSSGMGNAEFNDGKAAKFAYRLEQVYELNNPVSLAMMKKNGWVEGPPQRYTYVPPAVVGQLLGNLRCALFDESDPVGSDVGMAVTTSQELEEQIRSDIAAHTQDLPPIPTSPGPPPVNITNAEKGWASRCSGVPLAGDNSKPAVCPASRPITITREVVGAVPPAAVLQQQPIHTSGSSE